jgi:hypothetical protein
MLTSLPPPTEYSGLIHPGIHTTSISVGTQAMMILQQNVATQNNPERAFDANVKS